jgi:hypothetical protein
VAGIPVRLAFGLIFVTTADARFPYIGKQGKTQGKAQRIIAHQEIAP